MRRDKEVIFKMRQEGKSFRDIQKATGVSRGTLSKWFGGIDWSKQIGREGTFKQRFESSDRIKRLNMVRKIKLQFYYSTADREARDEYALYKDDDVFRHGLEIYRNSGSKTGDTIRVSSVNTGTHQDFIAFCEEYLGISRENMRLGLILYGEKGSEEAVDKWKEELDLLPSNIYKPYILKGRDRERRLHFGVGTTIIFGTYVKRKLLTWLKLELENTRDAAMV